MTSINPTASSKSWFIIRFDDGKAEHDVLYMNLPNQSFDYAASTLENTVLKLFGRTGDEDGSSYVKSLGVVPADPGLGAVHTKFLDLVHYIRDLPPSPTASKPDLFGLGSNKIRVEFGYQDYNY